jgi:hypothetical protein
MVGLDDCYFGYDTASLRKENYRVVNFPLLSEDGKLHTGEIYASKSGKDFYARLRLRGKGDSLFDIATGRKVEVNRLKMSFNNWGASDMVFSPDCSKAFAKFKLTADARSQPICFVNLTNNQIVKPPNISQWSHAESVISNKPGVAYAVFLDCRDTNDRRFEYVMNMDTGEPVKILSGKGNVPLNIRNVYVSDDGEQAYAIGNDKLVDLLTLQVRETSGAAVEVALSPNSKHSYVLVKNNGVSTLVGLKDMKQFSIEDLNILDCKIPTFSSKGELGFAPVKTKSGWAFYDLNTKKLKSANNSHITDIMQPVYSPTGSHAFASVQIDGKWHILDLKNDKLISMPKDKPQIPQAFGIRISFSEDEKQAFARVRLEDDSAAFLNLLSGSFIYQPEMRFDSIAQEIIYYSANNHYALVEVPIYSEGSQSSRVINLTTGAYLFGDNSQFIEKLFLVKYSPDGKMAFADVKQLGDDRSRLLDVAKRRFIDAGFGKEQNPFGCNIFLSPNSDKAFAIAEMGSSNSTLVDLACNHQVNCPNHRGAKSVTFSPDGRAFVRIGRRQANQHEICDLLEVYDGNNIIAENIKGGPEFAKDNSAAYVIADGKLLDIYAKQVITPQGTEDVKWKSLQNIKGSIVAFFERPDSSTGVVFLDGPLLEN